MRIEGRRRSRQDHDSRTGRIPQFSLPSFPSFSVLPNVAEPLWKTHYEMSASQCSHKYWSGGCQKSAKGLNCEIGLRTRTYHVLSGSVLSVWGTVEAVINSSGLQRTMQLIRLKTEDQKRIVGCLIPNNVVGNIVGHLHRLQSGEQSFSSSSSSSGVNRGLAHRGPTSSNASLPPSQPVSAQMAQLQRRTASPTLPRQPASASAATSTSKVGVKTTVTLSDDDDDDDPDDAELLGLMGAGKKTLDLFM